MGDIRRNQAKLSDLHEQSKTVTRSTEMHELSERMQAEIAAVSRSADGVKKRLAELDRDNEAALKKGTYTSGSSADRTRTAITGALKKKLKDLMGEFQDLRARVNAEYREVVERRVYTGVCGSGSACVWRSGGIRGSLCGQEGGGRGEGGVWRRHGSLPACRGGGSMRHAPARVRPTQ